MSADLKEFILKHKNLSGNKILKLYRKSGYHVNTQKFYEIKREIDNKNKKKNINYTNINVNINDYSKQKVKNKKVKKKEVKKINNKKEIKKENKKKNKNVKNKEVKKVKNKEKIKKVKPVYDKLAHNKINRFNEIKENNKIDNIKENKIDIKEQNNEVKEEIVLSDKEITENKIKKLILENPNLSKRELFKIIKQNDLHLRQSEILRLKREVLNIPLDESKSHKKDRGSYELPTPLPSPLPIPDGDIYGHLEKWVDAKDLYEALNTINKGKNIKHSHTKFIMIGAYYYDSSKHYIMYSIQNFNDLKYVLKEIINRRGMNTLIYKMLDCRKGFPNNKFMSGDLTVILND